ncbi:hypothetical protein PF004_g17138 [Phytophthora fragariae]|uniref:Uncharacterized protein n=1 Tax=Phytophthora fragariae TaxID=53985 RepID=A0A6G0NGC4_9STRA|nr:hypothetical protein PF004_g17138 [Phytophthora fragariae]
MTTSLHTGSRLRPPRRCGHIAEVTVRTLTGAALATAGVAVSTLTGVALSTAGVGLLGAMVVVFMLVLESWGWRLASGVARGS